MNNMMTGSKVSRKKPVMPKINNVNSHMKARSSETKAEERSERPRHMTARDRAECNAKPSWDHHTKRKGK